MNDLLDSAKTVGHEAIRDTIGEMLTQRPDEAVVLASRYRVVRRLGEGGMGSVWLAEDLKLDARQVAIKMLPVVLVANKRAVHQLKAEAKVAIRLAHPNIATLRAFEESHEGPFLVMDYIAGQTLEDRLADRRVLPEDEVIRIFTPLAQALDYAHSQGVIHRDLKPSNVLIRSDGSPFITDFGIAREIKDSMTRVTGRSTSGTLPYMSPEQLRGEPPTPSQDIYSLAATVYECVTGHTPFHRGQLEYQIANEAPEPIPSSISFSHAVMQALSKLPERRPACALAMLSVPALRPSADQPKPYSHYQAEATNAPPLQETGQTSRARQSRKRRLAPLLLLIVTALLCSLSVYFAMSRRVDQTQATGHQTTLVAVVGLLARDLANHPPLSNEYSTRLCREASSKTGARVTVILPSGIVIGDSEADPAQMENRSNHPEVVAAMRGEAGRSIRFSHTTRRRIIYLAAPVVLEGKVIAVVSVSQPLD